MVGFVAQEWLSSVSAAAKSIQTSEAVLRARRERLSTVGGSTSEPVVSRTRDVDVMRKVDDILDMEAGQSEVVAHARAEVAEARLVFGAMRRSGGCVAESAALLELVYADLMPINVAAGAVGVSLSTARRRLSLGVDWLDANGLPLVKAGLTSGSIAAL